MKNILIFRTDKFGDLINSSAVYKNIKENYPNSKVDLVCSNYNYYLAKNYKDYFNNIIIFQKPFFNFLFKNRLILSKKYDLLLVLDGKNHSFISSLFIKSSRKASILYIKKKSVFNFNFLNKRPNKLISFFFSDHVVSVEDFNINDNSQYHYLSLYLKLLEKLNLKIYSKDYFLPILNIKNNLYNSHKNHILLHVDSRWKNFNENIIKSLEDKIISLSKDYMIIITSDKTNFFIDNFSKKYGKLNVKCIFDSNIDDLISLVSNSLLLISSHSGLLVTVAASFKKPIIDIVSKDIFNELDRWIPLNYKYKRYELSDINELNVDFY